MLRITAEEDARVEAEAAMAYVTVPSNVAGRSSEPVIAERGGKMQCAVCFSPTNTRCSRCKAVRYCSGRCQILHWRQGHKEECHPFHHPKETEQGHKEKRHPFHHLKETEQSDQCNSDLDIEGIPPAIPPSESNFSSEIFSEDENHVVEPFVDTTETDSTSDSCADSLSSASSGPLEISHDEDSHLFDNAKARTSFPLVNSPDSPKTEADISRTEPSCQSEEVTCRGNGTSVSSATSEFCKKDVPFEDTSRCQAAVFDSREAPSSRIVKSANALYEEGDHSQLDARSPFRNPSNMPCQGTSSKSADTKENADCKAAPVVSSQLDCRSNGIGDLKTSVRKVVQQLKPSQILKHYPPVYRSDIAGKHKMLFPYDLFIKLHNNKTELHPCGLMNCGNSCYANAVLQCLAFTRPLRAYLLLGFHAKTCPKKDWCFTCELESLLIKAKGGQSPLSPIGILSHIQNIGSNLGHGSEEDAHEFLRYAIEAMQSVCLKEAGADAVGQFAEETTLIHLMFGGYIISKVKCMKCRVKSDRHERIMDLTVEIPGDIGTLEEALARYTSTEMLDGDNKYKCSRCNSFEQAKKKLSISEAPNILTIALKRFQFGNFGKLNKAVRFPEFLNLAPYMSGTDDKSPVYRLYAVVVHLDIMNAAFSGHYVCYVSSQKKWYKIDDSKVKQVEVERVLSQNAYMLFYARISPRAPRAIRSTMPNELSRSKSRFTETDISKKRPILTIPRPASSVEHDRSRDHPHWPDQHSGSWSPDLLSERYRYQRTNSSSDNSSLLSCSDEGSWSTESRRNSTSTDEFSDYLFGFSEDADGFTYSPLPSRHRDWPDVRGSGDGSLGFSYGDGHGREREEVALEERGAPPFLYSDLPDHSRKLTGELRSREQSSVSRRRRSGDERTAQTFCR